MGPGVGGRATRHSLLLHADGLGRHNCLREGGGGDPGGYTVSHDRSVVGRLLFHHYRRFSLSFPPKWRRGTIKKSRAVTATTGAGAGHGRCGHGSAATVAMDTADPTPSPRVHGMGPRLTTPPPRSPPLQTRSQMSQKPKESFCRRLPP